MVVRVVVSVHSLEWLLGCCYAVARVLLFSH